MTNAATAHDFQTWTDKAGRMTPPQLSYAIRDCYEAARAIDSHDSVRAGKYMDELSCYRTELNNR